MPSPRQILIATLGTAYGVLGPSGLDLRPNAVTMRLRTWSLGRKGMGTTIDVDTPITPTPKIRLVSTKEISGSAGRYRDGDIRIGPILPAYPVINGNAAGGYTRAQLSGEASTADGVERFVVITGIDAGFAGTYGIESLETDHSLGYYLVARSRRTDP